MKRRKHPPEFKLKVVKEAIEIGNCSLAARKYNLRKSLVSKWVRAYKNAGEQNFLGGKTSTDTNTYSSQEYKKMAKENEKLKKLYYYHLQKHPKTGSHNGGRPFPGYSLDTYGNPICDEQIKEYIMELIEGKGYAYGYHKLTICLRRKYKLIIKNYTGRVKNL
ncbi:MAG: Integrase, catalytic region [Clostridia bacterium 41_269]|nr:MAG: Integrase, catalytic region [Clostridia bacterium 41_269]